MEQILQKLRELTNKKFIKLADSGDHAIKSIAKLMKDLGYGKGYKYAHNFPNAKVDQEHLPEKLKGRKYVEEKN